MRLRSGLMYTLSELSNNGHVYAKKQQLANKASELPEAFLETIIMTMDEMLKKEELITEQRVTRTDGSENPNLSVSVEVIQEKVGMVYDEIQADAIRQAAAAKVMVLTGGPGTGKTTTAYGIISAYRVYGMKILLAAPTGRAAKRMTEATGLKDRTIYRLLEYKPSEGYQRKEILC